MGNGTQKKTVTFEEQDKEGEEVERNLEQDYLSRETNAEESRRSQDQDPGQENLSGDSEIEENNPDEEQDLKDLEDPELRNRHLLRQKFELKVGTVRASDPHTTIGDSSKRPGPGGISRP